MVRKKLKSRTKYDAYPLEGLTHGRNKQEGSESHRKRRRHHTQDAGTDDEVTETFEAEGQLNLMMADSETLTEEEGYLRGIWTSLGVGHNGYIDIDELARACSHIGMEEMNDMQLQQLFDKLDADGDGRVSFREFLAEFFQHNTQPDERNQPQAVPRSKGTTPTRALSAQKKLKFPSAEERNTPSIVQGAGISGLFSALDPDRTGFARPDAITDFWEKYNVMHGSDALLALGFDLKTKVNLSELSTALEQELLNAEDQSIVYLAATASYQQEIRYLKSAVEQAVWAKDKLKLDLSEANSRNNMLAKEVDERHANMEQSSQSRLFDLMCGIKSTYISIEQKYQDQVKLLQTDLDKERENMAQLSVRHKQGLERESQQLKQEEARLREQLTQTQKEMEKQSCDLELVSGQLEESERQGQRLQRELENMQGLHSKLSDYESKGLLTPEEQKFTQEKMARIEQENKDLKDCNDELTAEIETVRQELAHARRSDTDGDSPIRKQGSRLSDYIKPVMVKKSSSFSSTDGSDDDDRSGSSQGRRLPRPPHGDDEISIADETDKEIIEELRKELNDRREQLQQYSKQFETEKRDIEQAYKLEVNAVEERHDFEKSELLQHIQNEKMKISDEFERLQNEALSELAQELQTNFNNEKEGLVQKHKITQSELTKELTKELQSKFSHEKESLLQKHEHETAKLNQELQTNFAREKEVLIRKCETEKNDLFRALQNDFANEREALDEEHENEKQAMKEKYQTERKELVKRLGEEYKEELDSQLKTINAKHQRQTFQLEENIADTEPYLRNLEIEKSELDKKLAKLKEDSERQMKVQKEEIERLVVKQRLDMEEIMKERMDIEMKLKKQVNDLNLLNNAERLELQKEIDELRHDVRAEQHRRAELELESKQQKEELQMSFRQEKQEILELYEDQIKELEDQLQHSERAKDTMLDGGIDSLEGKLKEDFYQMFKEAMDDSMKTERDALVEEVEKELQEEFDTKQSERDHVLDREKTELKEKYEAQIHALQEELERLHEKMEEEREALAHRYETQRQGLEQQLATQIREELEEEFVQQMDEIREAYEDEKQGVQAQNALLTQEVEDLQTEVEAGNQHRKKFEELKRNNNKLQQEKKQVEKSLADVKKALEETKSSLEARIDELMAEKDGEITAVKTQMVESSRQSSKDKVAYETLLGEKETMERQMVSMKQELSQLQTIADNHKDLKRKVERLIRENDELRNRSSSGEGFRESVPPPPPSTATPEHAQQAIHELTHEKAELEDRLVEMQGQADELDDITKKYTHLQRKYEDVCKERESMSHLAKSLKEQLNKANTAHKDLEQGDKGQLTSVLEEKKLLELQLQRVSEKLLEATTNFSMIQTRHSQELLQMKEQCGNMVDLQKYTKLQIDLVDNQRSLQDMEQAVKSKEENSTKIIKETSEKHHEELKSLESQNESLMRQLGNLQNILKGQIEKFKQQHEASERRNCLVVDLYKENAQLMDSLYKVEQQKKDAVSKCFKLEDQSLHLKKMLKKMAKVAIS